MNYSSPLFRLKNLEKSIRFSGEIWAKAEYLNPTGSFKDRGSISEINLAITQKKKGVVCASTGNMAASLASFTARANLLCAVFIPDSTPASKLNQAVVCGAKVIPVSGNYDQCVIKAQNYALENNLLLCGDYEIRRLGQTSIGIELAQSEIKFDTLVVPVGNGTLACAISQGLAIYGKYPRLIGVQGTGANPIFTAWKTKLPIKAIIKPQTVASAMCVGNPLDGQPVLDWITKTNGQMISVSNREIIKSQELLAQSEGVFIEKSAAATISALPKINKTVKKTVVILTGSGLKES